MLDDSIEQPGDGFLLQHIGQVFPFAGCLDVTRGVLVKESFPDQEFEKGAQGREAALNTRIPPFPLALGDQEVGDVLFRWRVFSVVFFRKIPQESFAIPSVRVDRIGRQPALDLDVGEEGLQAGLQLEHCDSLR